MPDKDYIPKGLAPKYRKLYDEIVENKLPLPYIADQLCRTVKGDAKRYDDAPIQLIMQVANLMSPFATESQSEPDWGEFSMSIEALTLKSDSSRRASALASRACTEQLAEIRAKNYPDDLNQSILSKYLEKIYDARFEGAIPQTPPPGDVAEATIVERLQSVRRLVLELFKILAKRIAAKKTIRGIRAPNRSYKPALEKEMDLEMIGT